MSTFYDEYHHDSGLFLVHSVPSRVLYLDSRTATVPEIVIETATQ